MDEEKTLYARGYDLGLLCDFPGYQAAVAEFVGVGADWSELQAGWGDGVLDSWLHALRGDLKSIAPEPRSFFMAAIGNMVIGYKKGTEGK